MCRWVVSQLVTALGETRPTTSNTWWDRRVRDPRPVAAVVGNLVILPVILILLGLPSCYQPDGHLWLSAAGATTEHPQLNTTRDAMREMRGLESDISPIRNTTPPLMMKRGIPMPNYTRDTLSMVPSHDSDANAVGSEHNMQEVLIGRDRTSYAKAFQKLTLWRRSREKELARHRRAATDEEARSPSASDWILQPTPSPMEYGETLASFGRFTTVPDAGTIPNSVPFQTEVVATYASFSPQPTPSEAWTIPEGSSSVLAASTGTPFAHLSPSLQTPHPPSTIQPSPSPSQSTLPSNGAVIPTQEPFASTTTTPTFLLPSPHHPTAPSRLSSPHAPTPSEFPPFSSTVGGSDANFHQPGETDAVASPATPGETGMETRYPSSPSTVVHLRSSPGTYTSTPLNTPSSRSPVGPSNANLSGNSDKVYTIVSEIKTESSMLTIMPCLVGLALLGLVVAGIRRCLHHWRLSHMVDLSGDPEKQDREKDKGYTIENPMTKNRRSYVEQQMAKTLQKVNKTESSSSSNSGSNCSSRNGNYSKIDHKIRMEIATISDGSLRRPARPLRRSASERAAPSRRSSAGRYMTSSHSECRCFCHYSLGEREWRPLANGGVKTETATTRL